MNEAGRNGSQRGAQRFGLSAEAAQPKLATLVRGRRRQRGGESFRQQEPCDEEHRDHRDAGTQVWQRELGQQRDGAAASFTEVAPHRNRAVEGGVDDRAGVKAVGGECIFGQALRTMRGAIKIGVGELFQVLRHRASERVLAQERGHRRGRIEQPVTPTATGQNTVVTAILGRNPMLKTKDLTGSHRSVESALGSA